MSPRKRRASLLVIDAALALMLIAACHAPNEHLAAFAGMAVGYAFARLPKALAPALALAFMFTGCSSSSPMAASTRIAIAPSAEPSADAILEASERLNTIAGDELFTAHAVSSEGTRAGEVVISAGTCTQKLASACTLRKPDSVAIHLADIDVALRPAAAVHAIAHELGHAAGLGHSSDPGNLMFHEASSQGWALTPEQLEQLREAAEP